MEYNGKNVAIGTHGTALSTIINHYVPEFGFEGFQKIKGVMPWMVSFSFEGENCLSIEAYDPFTEKRDVLL